MIRVSPLRHTNIESILKSGRQSLAAIVGLIGVSLLIATAAFSAAITWDQTTAVLLNNNGTAADTLSQFIKGSQAYGAYYNHSCLTPCDNPKQIIDGDRTLTFNALSRSLFVGGGDYGYPAQNTGTALDQMMRDGRQGPGGGGFSFNVIGLTTGRQYRIQIFGWQNDSLNNAAPKINNLPVKFPNGSVASFVTGTFTADGTTQLLEFSGGRNNNFNTILITEAGPNAADTSASWRNNVGALKNMFSLQASFLNPGLSHDCALFDKSGICVAFSGRYARVNGSDGVDILSGAFIASYRVDSNLRIGAFIEHHLSDFSVGGIDHKSAMPDIGMFAHWHQSETGEGLGVRAAFRFGKKDLTITRDEIGTAERGQGQTELIGQGVQFTLSNGYRLNSEALITPYVGLRFTRIERAGYQEDSAITSPLAFDRLRLDTLSILSGIGGTYAAASNLVLHGSVGIEADIVQKFGDYAAIGVDGLEKIKFSDDARRIRGVVSAGASYKIDQTHHLSGSITVRQEALSALTTTTAMLTYIAAF